MLRVLLLAVGLAGCAANAAPPGSGGGSSGYATPWHLAAAAGSIPGVSVVHKFGRNDVTGEFELVLVED